MKVYTYHHVKNNNYILEQIIKTFFFFFPCQNLTYATRDILVKDQTVRAGALVTVLITRAGCIAADVRIDIARIHNCQM